MVSFDFDTIRIKWYFSTVQEFTAPFLVRVCVTQSLIFRAVLCRSLFVIFSFFSFGHCIVCPASNYSSTCLPFGIFKHFLQ